MPLTAEMFDSEATTEALIAPIQAFLASRYPDETVDVAFNPVGQVVGQLSRVEKSAAVIERWVQEYLDATGRLNAFNEAAEAV